MKSGYLSQYFTGVAAKKLSAVEVDSDTSNQHEFNGTKEVKAVLQTLERTQFPTKFLWIEDQNDALSDEGLVTWYDSRENHATRSEHRLYFYDNSVMRLAKEGDTMFLAKRTDETLLIILTSSGSTIESQLFWLFGLIPTSGNGFSLSEISSEHDQILDFATRFILDEIGIEVEEPETDLLDSILAKFPDGFPSTLVFSNFARTTLVTPVNAIDDPDGTLMAYMDWEEKLFRRFERHIVAKRLSEGFNTDADGQDVDGFISFSLSVQNRRKSRAGYSFEDHLGQIFNANKVLFTSKNLTENKSKPDFIFPGIEYYNNPSFPEKYLTMLGAKTSLKDRWRQVLAEANRITHKHIITLEPGISENQTNEMRASNLQLILPQQLHSTFTISQQGELLDVKEFISLVNNRQL
jgi:hypothetical protein